MTDLMTNYSHAVVLEGDSPLERRGLVRRERASRIEGDVELSFKHLLTREVAYATLPRSARRAGHQTVARFAEDTFGERFGDMAAIVGYHWREAGEPERAIEYFLAAAEQASRGWAKVEAANLYRQVLDLLPDGDPRRPRIRVQWGVAYQTAEHLNIGDIDALRRQPGKSAGEMSPPISWIVSMQWCPSRSPCARITSWLGAS
jgi:hypothetical protein